MPYSPVGGAPAERKTRCAMSVTRVVSVIGVIGGIRVITVIRVISVINVIRVMGAVGDITFQRVEHGKCKLHNIAYTAKRGP